jgi:hypothetical protein
MILLLSTAHPTLASWETRQTNGTIQTVYTDERYQLTIGCTHSSGLGLTLKDTSASGQSFDGIQNLMMWLTLPDGRPDR